ncbi:MAG: asparaginase [Candidatus Eisenbacteria bacterium]|uniref:Asparaginase n=1 Tax=Eiseniibacteriota bacterium TaxID=2212470 RepID=A0A538TPF9_UNCEI|nr:MAG: asparaginase [Candidatus Eisenbacteria bacterium]
MRLHIETRLWRGSILESRHHLQAAVVGLDGRIEAGTEQPSLVTTFRSSAKPFQLLPLVERGHAERWGWSDEQLAVMAASHTGSRSHRMLVTGILDRLGLSDRDLACGFHEPLDPEALAELEAHPELRSPLYDNCSGKHAGMLCLALSEGWPVAGYERADHPVQQRMRRSVAEVCGVPVDQVTVAVDGCSATVFGLPLDAMARGFAQLAAAAPDGDPRARALHRIREAMSRHPRVVGGEGRFSTLLMEATGGRLVAKGGAEGLECVAIPRRGLGVAVKCEDGQSRAVPPATIALLEQLGELSTEERARLAAARRPPILNHAGIEVGFLEAVVEILTPSAKIS